MRRTRSRTTVRVNKRHLEVHTMDCKQQLLLKDKGTVVLRNRLMSSEKLLSGTEAKEDTIEGKLNNSVEEVRKTGKNFYKKVVQM